MSEDTRTYVLQVNYGPGEQPVRVVLRDRTADGAETAHQAMETEIEHAQTLHAPVLLSGVVDGDPDAGVPIDPARVTGVDLVEPDASEV